MKEKFHTIKILKLSIALIATALLANSCKMFNAKPAEFLADYGTVISVGSVEYSGDYIEQGGALNVSSSSFTITYYLNNPYNFDVLQDPSEFELPPLVSFPEGSILEGSAASFNLVDNRTIKLSLSGYGASDGNPIESDISPTINIYRASDGRPQSAYTVKIRCNSAPPKIENAMGQKYSDAANSINNRLVIAFDMPALPADASELIVKTSKGGTYTFAITNGVPSSGGSWKISSTAPAGMGATYDGGEIFASSGGTPYYITTNIDNLQKQSVFEISLYLTDTYGLKGEPLTIKSHTLKLEPPTVSATTLSYTEDDDGAEFILTAESGANIIYTIKNTSDNSIYKESASGEPSPVKIILPEGEYSVTAHAIKDDYLDSEEFADSITVTMTMNPYVRYISAAGNDTSGNGTKKKPYATLQKALASFDSSQIGITDADGNPQHTVYILSDMNASSITFSGGDNVAVNLVGCKGGTANTAVSINCDSAPTKVLTITTPQTFVISDINFTQTSGSSALDYVIYNAGADLVLQNCSITGIKTSDGAVVMNGGKFIVKDATNITDNTDASANALNVNLLNNFTITVDSSFNGKLGVTTATAPTLGNPITITSGYKATKVPSTYFTSDVSDYSIGWNAAKTEAVLMVTGGSGGIGTDTPKTVTFALNALSGTITLSASADGTNITNEITKWNVSVYYQGLTNIDDKVTKNGNQITLPNATGIYRIVVSAEYNNTVYSGELTYTKN